METSLELKKYHILENIMSITDIKLLNRVEKVIISSHNISEKEMVKRASIAEKQFEEGKYKTHSDVRERLDRWIK